MTRIYDITRPLHTGLPPWPGDTPFDFRLTWQMQAGASVNVGAITSSTHNGTHADAPFHFQSSGVTIDRIDPVIYVGHALVADMTNVATVFDLTALANALAQITATGVSRLLLKTNAWPVGAPFPQSIPTLSADLPGLLGQAGVRLLGLDLPSVDPIESQDLANHHLLAAAGIHILESLDLAAVPAGVYELVALPLKIVGGDAAPVRAILRTLPD